MDVLLVIDNLPFGPGDVHKTAHRWCQMPMPPMAGMILQGKAVVPPGWSIEGFPAGARLGYTLVITEVQWDLDTQTLEAGCDLTDLADVGLDTPYAELLTLLVAGGWQPGPVPRNPPA